MKHLGDITKLSGYDLPIVDVLVGGSPCQDLSVAGVRKGLAGERSGLFMEQIRIVKEMRQRDARTGWSGYLVRPRYLVWENVPGAFSSNGGEDFRIVLEEICKVADENADVPRPPQKWSNSGCIMGDGWSVAWRVHDAQFWGVPQRRKRIALVADFGGLSAPEILFERKGLSGDSEPCRAKRETTAKAAGGCSYPTVARSLTQRHDGSPCIDRGPNIVMTVGIDGYNGSINTAASTLGVNCGMSTGRNGIMVFSDRVGVDLYNQTISGDIAATLNATSCDSPSHSGPSVLQVGIDLYNQCMTGDVSKCLNSKRSDSDHVPCVVYGVSSFGQYSDGTTSLRAQGGDNGGGSENLCVQNTTVRRLTPKECERLQGMPDDWSKYGINEKGDVYELSDSARYRLQGNGIATPFWRYLMKRITAQYERAPTLGSLFDGQASFPMIWEGINGQGTALWASEIEKHAIAVAKYHFPEEGD